MILIILSVVILICAVSLFYTGQIVAGLLFTALAVLLFLAYRKRKAKKAAAPAPTSEPEPSPTPTPQPAQATATAPAVGVISFRIAGTSFQGRQTTLRRIDEGVDDRYACCTYDIEQREYKGDPAFCIVAELMDDDLTRKELGFVPAELVPQVLQVFDEIQSVDVEVYGGGDDKNYGAQASLKYRV